jgi:hypothetical protein
MPLPRGVPLAKLVAALNLPVALGGQGTQRRALNGASSTRRMLARLQRRVDKEVGCSELECLRGRYCTVSVSPVRHRSCRPDQSRNPDGAPSNPVATVWLPRRLRLSISRRVAGGRKKQGQTQIPGGSASTTMRSRQTALSLSR